MQNNCIVLHDFNKINNRVFAIDTILLRIMIIIFLNSLIIYTHKNYNRINK